MEICILGWYGTETLGDRAILDGIFGLLEDALQHRPFTVNLGSLYPFLSERTILEDGEIFAKTAPNMTLKLFNSRNKDELREYAAKSDITMMGGGPIMELRELNILLYGFRQAKQAGHHTLIMGAEYGKLEQKAYIRLVGKILACSDSVIFRSATSKKTCLNVFGDIYAEKTTSAADPAVFSVEGYLEAHAGQEKTGDSIVVNFRDMNYVNSTSNPDDNWYLKVIHALLLHYETITLFPMHTFHIGGDDRLLLNTLKYCLKDGNTDRVTVVNTPMNLYQLYGLIHNAKAAVGMRYHSVVLETILNGNNLILDYTDPKKGKIHNFIEDYDHAEFYKNRYSIYNDTTSADLNAMAGLLAENTHFDFPHASTQEDRGRYIKIIQNLLKEKTGGKTR